MSEILYPKLEVPAPTRVYRRLRLEEKLAEAVTRRVVAVRAGPGYGKTTLVADFLRREVLPAVWVQVDERDRDMVRLARYLLAGISRQAGREEAGLFLNGATRDAILAACLDYLARAVTRQPKGPLVIVLNDLDLAADSETTRDFLSDLVEYLPGGVSLWFTCRTMPALPFPRWEALRMASELGEQDLALTPEEVCGFCRYTLGLDLDEATAELLHRASSGWITGLILLHDSLPVKNQAAMAEAACRLLQLLAPRPRTPAAGLAAQHGTQASVPGPPSGQASRPGGPASLYRYLAAEVLQRQRPRLRRFLMETAVLPFLSADACTALEGQGRQSGALEGEGRGSGLLGEQRRGGGLLGEVVQRIPMVLSLGEGHYAYHPMLQAFLLEKLREVAGKRHLGELYRRAGDYLAAHGWREQALDCYVHGEAWEQAAETLKEYGRAFAHSGSVTALEAWLEPLPREIVDKEPELLSLLGTVRNAQGRSDEAMALWQKTVTLAREALSRLPAATQKAQRGRLACSLVECRAQMADVLTDRGEAAEAYAILTAAVEEADDDVPAEVRARLYHSLARCAWMSQDWARTRSFIGQAMQLYARAGDRGGQAAMLNVLGAVFHEARGDLERALACCIRALDLAQQGPASPQILLYRINRDHILFEVGRTVEAIAGLEESVSLAERWGLGKVLTLGTMFLGGAYLDIGRVGDALVTLERALQMASETGDKLRAAGAYYYLANVHRARGELELALEAAREDLRLIREIGNPYFLSQSLTNVAFVHLHRGEGDAAIACLDEAEQALARHPNTWEQVRVHLGWALAYRGTDPVRSRAHLERCLALCEGRKYAMVFRREWNLCGPLLMEAVVQGIRPAVASRILADLRAERPPAGEAVATGPVAGATGPGGLPVVLGSGVVVRCLGTFSVWVDGREVGASSWPKAKALRLFKFLVANRHRWVPVDEVLEALWPDMDPEAASANFRVILHHARRALSGAGAAPPRSVLLYEQKRCRLDPGMLAWVDADEVLRCVGQGRRLAGEGRIAEAAAAFARADALYRGDFLAEDPYEEWAQPQREALRAAVLEALEWLARYSSSMGAHGHAAALLKRALALDPCREDVHRQLMLHLARDGRRAEALQQYRRCEEILARELGACPAPETTDLYRRLLRGSLRPAAPA